MSHNTLRTKSVIIGGKYFRVENYPWDAVKERGPFALKKGIAYRYETEITKGLYPYRGIIDDEDKFHYNTAKVGIWFRKVGHNRFKIFIVRPRTMKEAEDYQIGREKDIIAAMLNYEYTSDQFMESSLSASDVGFSTYLPPIHSDDDALNMLMKIGIRKKNAPFEPYGKRLQALAVDKRAGTERSNAKNNARRGIRQNRAMSASKFMQYGDAWQLEPAFILRDMPGAMHHMDIPEGKMLVLYPNGIPFDIQQENLINITDMIADAISITERDEKNDAKNAGEEVPDDDADDR